MKIFVTGTTFRHDMYYVASTSGISYKQQNIYFYQNQLIKYVCWDRGVPEYHDDMLLIFKIIYSYYLYFPLLLYKLIYYQNVLEMKLKQSCVIT